MNPERAEKLGAIRAIFDEAAELPAGARADFVRAACGEDALLTTEITSLLDALEHESEPLEADAGTQLLDSAPANAETLVMASSDGANLSGVIVGDFQLIRIIGRGAMGAVYEAEQLSLRRRVAVKLLQSWTASADARRRFIEEASILARLHHSGIAQVITAGTRQLDLSGPDRSLAMGLFSDLHSVPWIAMELVDGARTIVDHCRQATLSPMAVLQLFASVCDTVHHGHQQGVIHRDLKPANILVSAGGEPKVIDFGIAKAMSAGVGEVAAHTSQGGLLGTLCYMSPEQCDGQGRPIDTRTDVYALGVVLYEALTGRMPYPCQSNSFAGTARSVCEAVPANPRALAAGLPADASIVLLKALEKDPDRRYQSAAEFAAELRRVIAREPIKARRASVLYGLLMFARRRPATTLLVAAALVGLVAGVVGISVGLARESAARSEAERIAWQANLTAADSSLRLGDGGAAMRRLSAVPKRLRGWEWRYLHALADTSVSMWQITDKDARTYISPSGRWMYCGHNHDGDTHADIIDPQSRRTVARIENGVASGGVGWNADETLIAVPQTDAVVLRDGRTGRELRRWPQKPGRYPIGADFSPDGSLLAVGLSDSAGFEVYNLHTGETVFAQASDAWGCAAVFCPDNRTLAWSNSKGVHSVDTTTWRSLRFVPVEERTAIQPTGGFYSREGKQFGVMCGLVFYIIDADTWAVRVKLRGHAQRIDWASFDDTGERIATSSIDRTVRIWNTRTGELLTTLLGHESPAGQSRFIRDAGPGEPDVISVDNANRVRMWRLSDNGPVFTNRTDGPNNLISELSFSADGSTLRAAGPDAVRTIELVGKPHLGSIKPLACNFRCVVPGKDLVLSNLDRRVLALDSLTDGSRIWSLNNENLLEFVISPDGRLAAVFRDEYRISIIRITDGAEIGRTPAQPAGYYRPAFSPDGTTLATMSFSGVLRLWNTSDGVLKEQILGEGDRGPGLNWSGDGAWLAYSHAREGVTVLDWRTRQPITIITGVGGKVWALAMSPDKTRMAVGAQDRTTHIYELPTGDELLQLRNHTGTVGAVAWSPDGRYLATSGYDKVVNVYATSKELALPPRP